MAFDVVTAKQGKPHVTAEQQAMLHAGMLGKGRYRLDVLNGLACSMTDSNTLTVDTGGLMVDGRWVVNEAQTSFAIANGSQSAFRHDLAVLEIATDASTGITTIEEKVLQGASAATAAAAKDPAYDAGDLLDGLTAVVPIARIKLDGLTPTCEALLPSVADLKTLGDSVYPVGSIYMSTVATNPKTLLGFGTWERIEDRFLLAAGTTYKAGATGGEATHKLTVSEIPSHSHSTPVAYADNSGGSSGHVTAWGRKSSSFVSTNATGGGEEHNNMPPYLAVYMWKRTA